MNPSVSSVARPPSKLLHILAISAIVLAVLSTSGLLLLHFYGMMPSITDMLPWQIYAIIIVLWVPFYTFQTLAIARVSTALALFFLLAVGQTLHFIEHIAQEAQIYLLGLSGNQAHGLIGMLDLEWIHFAFDGMLIPVCTILLLIAYRPNPWLWTLLPLALWHAAEHFYIIHYYLQTGIAGSPGLLSVGGAINGGLPLARHDLHFLYNLAEEALILLGFQYELRRVHRISKPSVTTPVESMPVGATTLSIATGNPE